MPEQNTSKGQTEEYLTRKEVCQMLKIAYSTLYEYTKAGKLKKFGLGRRVYYKRSQIEEALIEI
ncbi:helix-turn-helix domain-containing protein [Gramella sp. GC03-9]|uniref:Helix-turn-helix domain-containing protein n=1 Tax=Christiangramia oceanisediminis TaxID=2920386 RepID=A0A9X2I6Y2_9FLAO|nr:helix-turn-helix domain-containing protein [Gramella oceanisediminis]MCP9198804.1 helix-turn-helix domain-containing protein [Gramella oceanisediminis]